MHVHWLQDRLTAKRSGWPSREECQETLHAMQENEIQDGSSVGVILCGHKEMCQSIASQMEAVGVSKERILLNF